MKRLHLLLVSAPILLAGSAWSAAVCNGTSACEQPDVTTQAPTINASSLLGLQSLNSVGPNGNQVNSNYWFAVTTTNHGSSTPSGTITNSGDGLTVVGNTPTHNASATPGSAVNSGAVQGTKGGTAYYLYAQACPNGTAANGTNCSPWGKVDASQITTSAYPAGNVLFSNPVKPTDATTNTIAVRTGVPAGDVSNVSVIDVTVNDVNTPANSQTVAAITYVGNTSPYTIDNSLYTNGFIPNTKYTYSAQVQYPWDLVPTGGPQTEGPFWTTPVNPGAVTTANITHCSVQITAKNASGSPANPSYTTYHLCASGTGGSCSNQGISGGTANDTAVVTISGLNPGTAYTPQAQALVGNGDGTSTGWNSSGVTSGSGFTTLGFTGVFGTANIATNSVDFTFSGLDLTGVTSYQISTDNGSTFGAVVNSAPVSPIHISGLTSNTQYQLKIKLIEASCSSILPASGVSFYTLPTAPIAPDTFTAPGPRKLSASWTDPATPTGNPNGSTYSIKYCTDAGFTTGCNTAGATKASTTPSNTNITTGVVPETQYFAEVKTVGLGGVDSAWLNLGNITTPNEAPTITSIGCAAPGATTTTCNAQATDNGALTQLFCHWSVDNSASVTAGNDQNADSSGNCPAITVTFPGAGPTYTVTLTVTDHNNVGGLSATRTATFSASQIPTAISVSPAGPVTVGRGQSATFTATVTDQFTPPNVMTNEAVHWAVTAGAGSLSAANAPSTIFTAGNTVNSYTLTASSYSATQTATINVVANTVTVSPSNPANIGTGGTQQFTVVVKDPQNNTITPTITWSVSGCSNANVNPSGNYIDNTGLFHGNIADTTPCTITATTQYGDTGTSHITVDNSVPQITVPPTLTLFVTSGTLSVSGTGFHGPSNLTYTWSLVSPAGADVTFTGNNGTTTGNNVTVTFHATGTYVFKATLTDTAGGNASNSANTTAQTLNATLTSITVTPNNVTIQALSAQQFMANGFDQFNNSTSAGNVTWNADGGGTISGAGSFSSPGLGNNIIITARNGAIVGRANVNVISFDVSGAKAYPVPFKSNRDQVIHFVNLGSQTKIRIYTAAGREIFHVNLTQDTYDWHVVNDSGERVASGVYLYFVESPSGKKDGKLIIIQ